MKNKNIIQSMVFTFAVMWLLLSSINVHAAYASISSNKLNATVGDSVIITVRYTAAAWNLHLSGAINDTIVGYDPNGVNTSQFQNFTLNTSSAGTYTVTLSGDVVDENEVNSPASGSVTVTVTNPTPPPTPVTPVTPSNPTTPTTPSNPSKPSTSNDVNHVTAGEEKSGNSNLKSITAEKYTIEKIDNTHYATSVRYSTDTLNLVVTAEDSKASVKGGGKVSLKVGENVYEIVVTAENGTSTTYYLTITRKDNQYKLKDLVDALSEEDEVVVQIEDGDIIKVSDFEKIKAAKKKVNFVRYDDEKKSVYSFVVDGNKLNNLIDLNMNVSLTFDDVDKFDEKVGYRKGLYFQLQDKIPKGISLQIPVDNMFKDGNVVNVYGYHNDKVKLLLSKKEVSNSKLEFPLSNNSKYFITQANISDASNDVFFIVAVVEFVCLFILVCAIIYIKYSKKNSININTMVKQQL